MRALLTILMVGGLLAAQAQDAAPGSPITDKGRSAQPEGPESPVVAQPRGVAAACAPATALRNLEWNNVRALLENGGPCGTTAPSTKAPTSFRRSRRQVVYGAPCGSPASARTSS